MATITSAKTGLWSATDTWVGNVVPVDNDGVVIASGHEVTFNVDTSGFANGIAGITITGTLSVSTTTSSYMKMKASTTISGAGTFNVGTSGTPIPFATKFTLTGGSGWYVQGNGGLTMGVYGAEPTYKYAKLIGAETAGSTRLEIDTDLTGDIWAVNDAVRIDNVNKAQNTEARTIGAITSTYIDITAGLTASKIVGSYVCLITRNVVITGLGTNIFQNFTSGKLIINGGSLTSDNRYVLDNCISPNIYGGVFSGNTYGLNACTGTIVTGGVFSGNSYCLNNCASSIVSGGIFSGNNYVLGSCAGIIVNGGIFSGNNFTFNSCIGATMGGGTLNGNGRAFSSCIGMAISGGKFSGGVFGLYQSSAVISKATFSLNTYDIAQSQFTAYNQELTSTVENYQYTSLSRNVYSESIDHDQSAGAFKSWTQGGVTTSVATPVPTGLTRSYQLALENASVEGFFNRRFTVTAGKTITIQLYLRKDISMSYLPRVWIHKNGTEPFTTPNDILYNFTMTNSTNTWETSTFTYYNSTDYDIELNARFVGMGSTGYVYGQIYINDNKPSITTDAGLFRSIV